jgi:uncharacterized membrane protein HdeD (DUF308 family)
VRVAGIFFVFAGLLAAFFPLAAGVTIELFFGALLAAAGAVHLVEILRLRPARGRPGHLLIGLAYLVGGALLLAAPMIGVAAVTLLIAGSFIVQGAAQLFFGLGGPLPGGKALMIASGVAGIFVGVLILAQWPSSAMWLVGLLAGINMFVLGLALLRTRVDATDLNS